MGVGGYVNLIKVGYEELVKAIIRPPRAEYEIEELGPSSFDYGGVPFVREDLSLVNPRGMRLVCSMWRRRQLPEGGLPCVIYMHGNASCRAEALQVLAGVLASGASLFTFDFAGCGMSEGDYISLGWYEKDDLAVVLQHLRDNSLATSIALWGRSMGAACSVMHASRDPSIAGLICDSPFASLEQVALELVANAPQQVPGAPAFPSFLVKTLLWKVAMSVKHRAGFDLYKLRPVDAAKTCYAPALFGAGTDDVLVRPHHSKQIYDLFAGDKNFVTFEGDHNDVRPDFFMDSACIFLKNVLLIPESAQLDVPLDANGRPRSIRHVFARGSGHQGYQHAADHHFALAEAEEEMLRQAILASLRDSTSAADAPSPPPPAPPADLTAALMSALSVAGGADRPRDHPPTSLLASLPPLPAPAAADRPIASDERGMATDAAVPQVEVAAVARASGTEPADVASAEEELLAEAILLSLQDNK